MSRSTGQGQGRGNKKACLCVLVVGGVLPIGNFSLTTNVFKY